MVILIGIGRADDSNMFPQCPCRGCSYIRLGLANLVPSFTTLRLNCILTTFQFSCSLLTFLSHDVVHWNSVIIYHSVIVYFIENLVMINFTNFSVQLDLDVRNPATSFVGCLSAVKRTHRRRSNRAIFHSHFTDILQVLPCSLSILVTC